MPKKGQFMLPRRKVALIVSLVMVFSLAGASDSWASDPFTKLGRGFANALTGWMEMPKTVHKTTLEENWFSGWTNGLAHGTGRAIARTGTGLYEMLTFLIPAPNHYEPMMEPEFVF